MQSFSLRAQLVSLMWRLLGRYGRIKYRYLLPIYRLFGHLPSQPKADGRPSKTLRGAQAVDRILRQPLDDDQLRTLISRIKHSNGAVVFLSSIGWNVVNTQRSQHLAREFARQGYVAIFDSSGSFDDVSGLKEVERNLFLIREPDRALSEIPDPILWSFPHNYLRRDAYPASTRTIYDWIDDFDVFNFDRDFLERNHERALKEASLVLTVARVLHERVLASRPDALYLPNGVDYDHFAGNSVTPVDDRYIPPSWLNGKPLAGYYGAMAEWFDYELLAAVARLRPDWNFVLIGQMYDNSLRDSGRSLLRLSNVRWIGPRGYPKLPQYLSLFDVAMIPFAINDITRATSPLKLYEYFAGGKPVIATPMPECQAFPEVHIVRDAEEFSQALDLAKAQGQLPEIQERLRQLGRENSWTSRVELILKHLQIRDNLS
ncbi:MAG: glycosyltransferase [Acidobacteriota bacterium]